MLETAPLRDSADLCWVPGSAGWAVNPGSCLSWGRGEGDADAKASGGGLAAILCLPVGGHRSVLSSSLLNSGFLLTQKHETRHQMCLLSLPALILGAVSASEGDWGPPEAARLQRGLWRA